MTADLLNHSDLKAVDQTTGRVVARCVERAADWKKRLKGLIGRAALAPDHALWIIPCSQIHTFFMKFPIDALFLSRPGEVVGLAHDLKPWRISRYHPQARTVLELPAGTLARHNVNPGHIIQIR